MVFWKTYYYYKTIDPWINCDYMVTYKSKWNVKLLWPIKSKLQIGTDFKGVSKLSKYFYSLAALVSFISKFQEFSTTYYCWSLHRFQTYLNYHFYEELGMNNLHILFSGDEITYQVFFFLICTKWQWALFLQNFLFKCVQYKYLYT